MEVTDAIFTKKVFKPVQRLSSCKIEGLAILSTRTLITLHSAVELWHMRNVRCSKTASIAQATASHAKQRRGTASKVKQWPQNNARNASHQGYNASNAKQLMQSQACNAEKSNRSKAANARKATQEPKQAL